MTGDFYLQWGQTNFAKSSYLLLNQLTFVDPPGIIVNTNRMEETGRGTEGAFHIVVVCLLFHHLTGQ